MRYKGGGTYLTLKYTKGNTIFSLIAGVYRQWQSEKFLECLRQSRAGKNHVPVFYYSIVGKKLQDECNTAQGWNRYNCFVSFIGKFTFS